MAEEKKDDPNLKLTDNDLSNLKKIIESKLAVNLSPGEMTYIYNLAAKKFQTGDFQGAIPFFQFLLLKDMKNTLYLKSLGSCLQNLEKFQEAQFCYQTAFTLDPNDFECLFYMGFCCLKIKLVEPAKTFLSTFIEKLPDHPLAAKAKLFLNGLNQELSSDAKPESK